MGTIRPILFLYSRKKIFIGAIIGIAYFVVSYASFLLFPPPSVIVPAIGIAIAGLFLGGLALWPAVFIAAIASYLLSSTPLVTTVVLSVAHTLTAIAAAYLLQKFDVRPRLARLRDMLSSILIITVTSTIVPTLGWLILPLFPTTGGLSLSWGQWWTSIIFSALITTTVIIRWSVKMPRRTLSDLLEALGAFSICALLAFFIFWTETSSIGAIPLIYVLLMPLLWITLRFGPRLISLTFFTISVIAFTGAYWGASAPENIADLERLLFQEQLLLGILAILFFILISIEEERKDAIRGLTGHVQTLGHDLEKTRLSEREKIEFLAILAHELRNPLSPIISSLDLIAVHGPHHESTPRLLGVIDTHVRTIAKLLDDLLDVTRISRRRMKLEKEPVELQAALQRSLQTVQPFVENRGHRLNVKIPKTTIWVEADIIRLTQIFANLLLNAAKYTEPGGTITLRCKVGSGKVAVSIKDTGIGIPPEMIPDLFRPFTRLNQEQSGVGTGLGIGLSLTKQLVEMHGGTISVRSKGKDKGSEFIVELPITSRTPLPLIDTGQMQQTLYGMDEVVEEMDGNNIRVLIVDDNEAAANGLQQLLEHYHYTVRQAHEGAEAIAIASNFNPHIILLDIGLPDIDGYKVAETLSQTLNPSPVFIALTGYGQEENRFRAQKAGIRHYLTKPVGIADILAAIEKNLNLPSSHDK